jgi:hypothetical protein
MRLLPLLIGTGAAALACASEPPGKPCDHLYGVIFQYDSDSSGRLKEFALSTIVNCHGETAPLTIDLAWQKTACVMLVLDGLAKSPPNEGTGRPSFIYYVYDTDRPNRVYRDLRSGSSMENPSVGVREEILKQNGSEKDGSKACDQIGRPAA